MTAAEIAARLKNAHPTPNGWVGCCPAHDDRKASLCLSTGEDGRVLLHCQAGCTFPAVCAALAINPADLFPANPARDAKPRIVKTYDYLDADGKLLFQVCRYEPKDFRQRRPDPDQTGKWIDNVKGVERVLYRLPAILNAVELGETVFVVAGEKDADNLVRIGFCATTNPGGEGVKKWLRQFTATLASASVVIIADKDKTGRAHGQTVAAELAPVANSVRLLELPDRPPAKVKDASDWIQAGGTAEELRAIVAMAPEWRPPEPPRVETEPAPDNVRGAIVRILLDKDLTTSQKRQQITRAITLALTRRGKFFFHQELRDFDSAMFFDAERKRLERIRADAWLSWLSDWTAINRADGLFKYVQADIETASLSSRDTTGILPEYFWATRPGVIYLSRGDGQAVKIMPGDVRAVDNGADGVLFAAGKTLAPWKLTEPLDPFATCRLFRECHTEAPHGQDLLRLWIFSLPTNPRCKPPLALAGVVGAGKTRMAKGIAEFYGLPFLAAKVEESAEADFWPAMDQGGLFVLDNADSKCRWLADSMAAAATDGCAQRRRLYTNSETVTLRARAWVAVTTSNPTFANDAGLADRLLLVRMTRRDDETSEAALTDEILAARDAGLSFTVQTLAAALADNVPTPAGLNHRHPDFAAFAVRLGRALGREAEAMAALQAAEADKSAFCLENDSIGAALLAYLEQARKFAGTAAELVPHLIATDADLDGRLSAKRLGKRLAVLWPHLQHALTKCRKEPDRTGLLHFTFQSDADYADSVLPFSQNPLREGTQ